MSIAKPAARGAERQKAPLVFVSYAHEDENFLKGELLPFLRQLEELGHVELWHDRNIGVGEDWYAQIADRLDQAQVAVLLLSQPFLASKFCRHEEVPVLLQRARAGKLAILPLLVDHCFYEIEPWLKRLQIRPQYATPLSTMTAAQRSEALKAFAKETFAATRPDYRPPQAVRRDSPRTRYDLDHLPDTGDLLFGREELRLLDRAWSKQGNLNVVVFRAGGGVGKSALVRTWSDLLAEDKWRGAERAFGWSFYSQGTGRAASSERFVDEALRWWGQDPTSMTSHWDRAERLVECVRRERSLLVLDGIEPLQSAEASERGRIKDPALRVLIESLAEENPGLCVVTTREELVDLHADTLRPHVVHVDLEQVSPQAGRALLRVQRVRGDDTRLEEVVSDHLGRHALAVSLFATYAAENEGRSVEAVAALPPLAHAVEEGGYPRRVMEAWIRRLGDGPEIDLLHALGLFDRPAALKALEALVAAPDFKGLNVHLAAGGLGVALARLRAARLIAASQREASNLVDPHPLVREHFGARLKERASEAWTEGHRRLYEHYRGAAADLPETLAQMEPLFAAIVHGIAAGCPEEVGEEILNRRIVRGSRYFLTKELGAFPAYLGCLMPFFAEIWRRPLETLPPEDQSWFLHEAGFALRALGRSREAVEPIEAALRRRVNERAWERAAVVAGNLSELHTTLGDLEQSETRAREAVEHADRSGSEFQEIVARAKLAGALHQRGDLAGAQALFEAAESRQRTYQPHHPLLYSLGGYLYCDLLLDQGSADVVVSRAAQNLEWVTARRWLIDIGLNHLSLGHAHLAVGKLEVARANFDQAVDGLRAAGSLEYLARGLLGRVALFRTAREFVRAGRDLAEARKIAERSGFRLYAADCALEEARIAIAESEHQGLDAADVDIKLTRPRAAFRGARALVEQMGYGRRRPELTELARALGESVETEAKT